MNMIYGWMATCLWRVGEWCCERSRWLWVHSHSD
jgi:hypothetical protein